jgi:hypothetical protein
MGSWRIVKTCALLLSTLKKTMPSIVAAIKYSSKLHGNYRKKRLLDHKAGFFYNNDSMASSATKPNGIIKRVIPFVWLLNMMSHYHPYAVEN